MYAVTADTWSDYDGDSAYGDYTVSGSTVTDANAYEPGVWRNLLGSASGEYLHNDHLGTMLFTTTASATASTHRVHTAFGERMGQNRPNDRFGYAGAWGYQRATTTLSSDPYRDGFPFLHVGARYYDPASGRFLQRDPIGIRGGTNVYVYAFNAPTVAVDPNGELWWVVGALIGGITGGISSVMSGGSFVAGAVGGAVNGARIVSGTPAPVAGAIGGAITGAVEGLLGGGSPGNVITGAVVGGISGTGGAVFGRIATGGAELGIVAGEIIGFTGGTVANQGMFYHYEVPRRTLDNMLENARRWRERTQMTCLQGG